MIIQSTKSRFLIQVQVYWERNVIVAKEIIIIYIHENGSIKGRLPRVGPQETRQKNQSESKKGLYTDILNR